MTPQEAINLLYCAANQARLTKEDHVKCEQANEVLVKECNHDEKIEELVAKVD